MTSATDSLLTALPTCDMLLIDTLHAFDFSLEAGELRIECMDGRENKRWHFSQAQVAAATFDEQAQDWLIHGADGEHRLVCMSAFSAREEDIDQV